MDTPDEPLYFPTPAHFRKWLKKHHTTEREAWIVYYRKGSGKPTMTWPESVDEALCVGWIDGIRKRIDDERHMNRFTPRKPTSNWSLINIARMAVLMAEGRVLPAGLAAFARRTESSPVIELNRAAAVAMRDGPAEGLALIDAILARGDLADYHLAHSARADLCRRLGRTADARDSYQRALALTRQEPERRFIERRLSELPA